MTEVDVQFARIVLEGISIIGAFITAIVLITKSHGTIRFRLKSMHITQAKLIKANMPFTRSLLKLSAFASGLPRSDDKHEKPIDDIQPDLFAGQSETNDNNKKKLRAVK